jgi:23S rRNA (pseudouridine1915-N3)-methyltransferase
VVRTRAARARGELSLRLSIAAVGRLKAGAEKQLVGDYLQRAEASGRSCGIVGIDVREFAESRQATPAGRLTEEAKSLASAIPSGAFAIVLDERGKSFDSAGFAKLIREHLDRGTHDLAFLIGGPDGHAQPTRDSAGLVMSFGPMTWPHRLVRIMLAEQIYRAVTILVNHPYHRP